MAFADIDAQMAAAANNGLRLEILICEAKIAARNGEIETALELAARAETLARLIGDNRQLGRMVCVRANCDYLRADYANAHKRSLESSEIAERNNDIGGHAAALLIAAACQYQMGAHEEAHSALMQVLESIVDSPDDEIAFRSHNMLGMIFSGRDDFEGARRQFDLAIAAGCRMGDEYFLQRARVNRASLSLRVGDSLKTVGRTAEAVECYREGAVACEAIRSVTGGQISRENLAGCVGVLGELYQRLGRTGEAFSLFGEMLTHGETMKNEVLQAEALAHLGRHHTEHGDLQLARHNLDRSLVLAKHAGARRRAADVHASLARLCEVEENWKAACECYKTYHAASEEVLHAEIVTASRVRTIWREFQKAQREARKYRERFETLLRENKALEKRATGLSSAALEDPLTGLANRRSLDARIRELVGNFRDRGLRLTIALIDIDHFKDVNDHFSHVVGDTVLSLIAKMIRTHCREGDVAARFGGDEFVICLVGASRDSALPIMEQLRSFVENYTWSTIHPELKVTVSIGVAQICESDNVAEFLSRADAAMYAAKKSGRNSVSIGL